MFDACIIRQKVNKEKSIRDLNLYQKSYILYMVSNKLKSLIPYSYYLCFSLCLELKNGKQWYENNDNLCVQKE